MSKSENHAVVLFDGVCNFCNGSVQFIIRRDRAGYFRFASLQSDAAKSLLSERVEAPNLDSIILIENGRIFTESTAVLRIARKLDGIWKAAALFLIVPKPVRNWAYRLFARNRYRWFGKRNECMLPTPEQRQRFLSMDEAGEV
ncbi:thiol-disulfide oxidoreductase DCC family protein [Paenibacillus macerans]|uniref:thiol-disulfide oxidoreductase DCC family protein n=1 Tax=Paenibacillus macerans TaxID=44252 RepID=UPI00203DD83E|nr:thiol-disulfide oxidoreductase DCC family protein [Paenibacillus macerans]MCM3700277.1 thiol-disulfide oxidoreductase DCC family protein [Paenibacillus macerans]